MRTWLPGDLGGGPGALHVKWRPTIDQKDTMTGLASIVVDEVLKEIIALLQKHPRYGKYTDIMDARPATTKARLAQAREARLRAHTPTNTARFTATELQFLSGDFAAMYTNVD